MRLAIALISTLALGCLAGGLALFSGSYALESAQGISDLRMPVVALGLIFLAVLCERLAVGLAFAHSHRQVGKISSLLLALCCLLIMGDSLFFALRVRGLLVLSRTLLGLPLEEALPPIEVVVFGSVALGYAVWPPIRRLGSAAAKTLRGGNPLLAGRGFAPDRRESVHA